MAESHTEISTNRIRRIISNVQKMHNSVDISRILRYINKQVLKFRSTKAGEESFFPKDEKMTLSCQNFDSCGVKMLAQKRYNKYMPETLI